ncbi:hypothetical protein RAS1_31700 [Phycisphaerae bacterium RAS1]|nr:hypothetical protein RAS1_31700 [Phycisphaerae bacterium RAS1]
MSMFRSKMLRLVVTTTVMTAAAVPPVSAQNAHSGVPTLQNQVNGAGATLFVDVFDNNPALTNDWIDVDGDGRFGFYDSDNNGSPDAVDQLAPNTAPTIPTAYWIIQYRSVGSVEGYLEFVTYQLCGDLNEAIPSERGLINNLRWSNNVPPNQCIGDAAAFGGGCTDDTMHDNDGNLPACTPRCPSSVDFANLDVPALYGTQGPAGTPQFDRNPGEAGYGLNDVLGNQGTAAQGGQDHRMVDLSPDCAAGGSLNLNTGSPDANTLYDTQVAWSPVVPIANRGTNLSLTDSSGFEDGAITWNDLRYGQISGRRSNGENLVFATRDAGSGTRNAWANSLGVDPSQAVGDNIGVRALSNVNNTPGPNYQSTNNAGSGDQENTVQSNRLAVGYTGFFGGSRAVIDARGGAYELLGYKRGAEVVRPTLEAIINNSDINTGFQIGGVQSFVTRGNPRAHDFGVRAPATESGPLLSNIECAQFMRNVEESLIAFNASPCPPGTLPAESLNMPGETLARRVAPTRAPDSLPTLSDPDVFTTNLSQVADTKCYVLNNNAFRAGGPTPPLPYGDLDASGVISTAGRVATRRAPLAGIQEPWFGGNGIANTAAMGDDVQLVSVGNPVARGQRIVGVGANGTLDTAPTADDITAVYRDGGTTSYRYVNGGGSTVTIAGGSNRLSQRNRVQGDANNDGARNINDINRLVDAENLFSTAASESAALGGFEAIQGGHIGSMAVDRLIAHVNFDLNSDGEFDREDIRYFCDGLALTTGVATGGLGTLDRREAFTRADARWLTLTGSDNNLLNTGLKTCKVYAAGDSRGDVAGSVVGPAKGSTPTGWDGVVNEDDIDYVRANFGTWSNINDAARIDLSCDMNGDMIVDNADVVELVTVILGTNMGDVDLDGDVDQADADIIVNTPGAGWRGGDLNGDGVVDNSDLAICAANQGFRSPFCPCAPPTVCGDSNCDGNVNILDINYFVAAVQSRTMWDALADTDCDFWCANDINGDGFVNILDINGFVSAVGAGACP